MTINRTIKLSDSIEATLNITLTGQEVYEAFREKEFEYDRQDIQDELENREAEDAQNICGVPCSFITESMIDDMASEMRRQIDKYDVSWDYARDEAIQEIIEKELKKRESAE